MKRLFQVIVIIGFSCTILCPDRPFYVSILENKKLNPEQKIDQLQQQIAQGQMLTELDSNNNSILHYATVNDANKGLIPWILQEEKKQGSSLQVSYPASPNPLIEQRNHSGLRPLDVALNASNVGAVSVLLNYDNSSQAKALAQLIDHISSNKINEASKQKSITIAQLLVAHGEDISQKMKGSSQTLLQKAQQIDDAWYQEHPLDDTYLPLAAQLLSAAKSYVLKQHMLFEDGFKKKASPNSQSVQIVKKKAPVLTEAQKNQLGQFLVAILEGDIQKVNSLIDSVPQTEKTDALRIVLHQLSEFDNKASLQKQYHDIIKTLVTNGADITGGEKNKLMPLALARALDRETADKTKNSEDSFVPLTAQLFDWAKDYALQKRNQLLVAKQLPEYLPKNVPSTSQALPPGDGPLSIVTQYLIGEQAPAE